MAAGFLNVDLEVESSNDLEPLACEFGERIFVLYCGKLFKSRRFVLTAESNRQYKGPDSTIHALCSVVENLSPAGKRLWRAATRRTFDLGYRLPQQPEFSSAFRLRADTLKRVTELGATIAATFYQPLSDEELAASERR